MTSLKIEKLPMEEIDRIKRNIRSLLDLNKSLRSEITQLKDANPWYPVHGISARISANAKRIRNLQELIGCKYV